MALASCSSGDNSSSAVFNGQSYDISAAGDSSLTANIKKISGGYSVTIDGFGKSRDFVTSKSPWYSITPKVTEVVINKGITYAGEGMFAGLSLSHFILPSSLLAIGDEAFENDVSLYTYATEEIETDIENPIYYYSATAPSDTNKQYWHYVGDQPTVWVVDTLNVLFIGNSFTYYNDMPVMVEELATSMGYSMNVDSVTRGSTHLYQWTDATSEAYTLLETALATSSDYDYVILQGQSTESYTNYDRFLQGAKDLAARVLQNSPNAQIRLYETWGFPAGLDATYTTIEAQEAAIRERYELCANEIGAKVHYVGKAFTDCYYNYPSATSGISLYNTSDYRHPSLSGSYLAALVHLGYLINSDIRVATYVPTDLDATVATNIKEVAYHNIFQ